MKIIHADEVFVLAQTRGRLIRLRDALTEEAPSVVEVGYGKILCHLGAEFILGAVNKQIADIEETLNLLGVTI